MPIPILEMGADCDGFVVGLPTTVGGYDSIWVIVDNLTKFAHFIPVKVRYTKEKLAHLYISQIVRLHRMAVYIVSNLC